MPKYTTGDIRNIALAGTAGAGKTTLVEAMLHNVGQIGRVGRVDDSLERGRAGDELTLADVCRRSGAGREHGRVTDGDDGAGGPDALRIRDDSSGSPIGREVHFGIDRPDHRAETVSLVRFGQQHHWRRWSVGWKAIHAADAQDDPFRSLRARKEREVGQSRQLDDVRRQRLG